MTDTTWFKRLNRTCWRQTTGKNMPEKGRLWQSVWGMGGFSPSPLTNLPTPELPPGTKHCDQVLQLEHLLLRGAAKATAFGCDISQITKLVRSSRLTVSELALPVPFPIKNAPDMPPKTLTETL